MRKRLFLFLGWVYHCLLSYGGDYGYCWERNGESCITVGFVARTAGILTHSVKGADY